MGKRKRKKVSSGGQKKNKPQKCDLIPGKEDCLEQMESPKNNRCKDCRSTNKKVQKKRMGLGWD